MIEIMGVIDDEAKAKCRRRRKEASFAVAQACATGTDAQSKAIVGMNGIPALITTINNSPFRDERERFSFAECRFRTKR